MSSGQSSDARVRRRRQLERECRAAADALALRERAAAVALGGLRDDEQAEAGAFDALRQRPRRAIEAAEDALRLVRRNADALVAHADDGEVLFAFADLDFDAHVLARVLHRVVQQVEDRAAKMIGIAHHFDRLVGRPDHAKRRLPADGAAIASA